MRMEDGNLHKMTIVEKDDDDKVEEMPKDT